MIEIIGAVSTAQIEDVRVLFKEYEAAIGIDLCFQNFDEELKTLPGKYAPPKGGMFIAVKNQELFGCVALRPLEYPDIAELKRLYVRPAARGKGLGLRLTRTALQLAANSGYKYVRLDTLATMTAARNLYKKLGFVEIPPYTFNPLCGAIYMELELSKL